VQAAIDAIHQAGGGRHDQARNADHAAQETALTRTR
jgi:hypothetical protein